MPGELLVHFVDALVDATADLDSRACHQFERCCEMRWYAPKRAGKLRNRIACVIAD